MNFLSKLIAGIKKLFGKDDIYHADKEVFAERGESLACRYLKRKGYQILERGWRWHRFELDIIALKDNFVVFVEVKTRRSKKFGQPQEAVKPEKQRRVISAARAYYQQKRIGKHIMRFDIIGILATEGEKPVINHIENAFQTRL